MIRTQLPFNIATEQFGNLQWVDPFRNHADLEIILQEFSVTYNFSGPDPGTKHHIGRPVHLYLATRTANRWTAETLKNAFDSLVPVIKQMLRTSVQVKADRDGGFENVQVFVRYDDTSEELGSFTCNLS